MCQNVADSFVGGRSADRSLPAWAQAYRAVQHGFASTQCKNKSVVGKFPREIEDFANAFVLAQSNRVQADYDPAARFERSKAQAEIALAEAAILGMARAPLKDRRAFAVWVTISAR